MSESEFLPSEGEIEEGIARWVDLANRRYPGLVTLIKEATTGLYAVLGSYDPGEAEVEGPERLQDYHGFSDEIMSYLFHQDYPDTGLDDVMAAPTLEEAEARTDDSFSEHANMLKVMGDLFHYAASVETPMPEE